MPWNVLGAFSCVFMAQESWRQQHHDRVQRAPLWLMLIHSTTVDCGPVGGGPDVCRDHGKQTPGHGFVS